MSNLDERYQRVMVSMAGNEALAESLDENAAGELFSWMEKAVKTIVDRTDGLDDEAAEEHMAPRMRALRLMMRAVSRWVGERNELDAESSLFFWNRIGEQARTAFGESVVLPSVEEAVTQIPAGANAQQVIAWLKNYIDERGPQK